MKDKLHRFFRWNAQPERLTEAPAFVSLSHLVQAVEPDLDLLDRIEAEIDAFEPMSHPRTTGRTTLYRNLFVAATSCLMLLVLILLFAPDRQKIVARPSSASDWVPLGAVSLHGASLRAFVRGKCKGHTHFFITMHGVSLDEIGASAATGTPLAQAGEKILMECIF